MNAATTMPDAPKKPHDISTRDGIIAEAANRLKANGIKFSFVCKSHLAVENGERIIDFWPTIALWVERGTIQQWRGTTALINYIKQRDMQCK